MYVDVLWILISDAGSTPATSTYPLFTGNSLPIVNHLLISYNPLIMFIERFRVDNLYMFVLTIDKIKFFLSGSRGTLIIIFKFLTSELFIWSAALFYLALFNQPGYSHFTICPLNNLDINFCPGCGLGNSISFLFHADVENSLAAHPFGIAALPILVLRILSLIKQEWSSYAKRTTINA